MKNHKIAAGWPTAILVCLLTFAAPSSAEDTSVQQRNVATTPAQAVLSGDWKRQETETQRAARYKLIDQATSSLGWLQRGKVQAKLREVTALQETLTIIDSGKQVTLAAADKPRIVVSTDGVTTKMSGPNASGTIQAGRQDRSLLIKVTGRDGARTTKYTLSDDNKKLTLDVAMASSKLPRTIQYTMTYVRAPAGNQQRSAASTKVPGTR